MPAPFVRTRDGSTPKASRGGGGGNYQPIAPGVYVGLVESAESATYTGKDGTEYLKITPVFKVLDSEPPATIKYSDVVFGSVDENGELYRVDGDSQKSALFTGAGFFLSAVGFVSQPVDENDEPIGEPVVDLDSFHPSLIGGQIIKIKVETSNYNDKNGTQRTKNVVTGFYGLTEEEAKASGYFVADTGMYFENEEASAAWDQIYDELQDESETEDI